jgi:alpha-L-fucosidase 2
MVSTMPNDDASTNLTLWYDRPAREAITEGLPLGNGHLGVLVLGGPQCDRWVLNEGTLFTGGPYEPINPEAKAALPEVQRLIFAGKYREATALTEEKLLGRPKFQASFQPLGDLWVEFPEHVNVTNYRRELDLDRAVHTVRYTANGVDYVREMFVSAPDQVLVARFTASRSARIDCVVRVNSEQRGQFDWQRGAEGWYSGSGFGIRGRNRADCGVEGALKFEFSARLRGNGGRIMPGDARVSVRDADELVLIAAAATNYKSFADLSQVPSELVEARLDQAAQLTFGN